MNGEYPISISALNDFIFCPLSIYFHMLYDGMDKTVYQNKAQLDGTKAHETVDAIRRITASYSLKIPFNFYLCRLHYNYYHLQL